VIDVERYVSQGRQCVQEGSWRDAIRCFQAALRIDLECAQAHLGLGVAYWHLGRTDEAIFEYRTALRLEPSSAEAHFGLGVAYRQQGRLEEAIQEYLAALRLNPVYAQAHYNLGVAYCQQDRWDEAISEFQAVLCITPDDADARFGLGLAYKQLGHLDQAIREYQFSLRFNPGFARAHYNLAVACLDKGLTTMAVREAERARELGYEAARVLLRKLGVEVSVEEAESEVSEPPAAETGVGEAPVVEAEIPDGVRKRLEQGLAYLEKDKYKRAAAVFEDVVAHTPELVSAQVALVRAYMGERRWDDASAVLRSLLEQHPDNGEAHYLLGQALAATDHLEEAIEEIERALSLGYERADKYLTLLREYLAEKTSPQKTPPSEAESEQEEATAPQVRQAVESAPVPDEVDVPVVAPATAERTAAPEPMHEEELPVAIVEEELAPDTELSSEEDTSEKPREAAPQQPPDETAEETMAPAARVHFERGQAFADGGRWDEAIREFQAALEEDAGFNDAYVAMGKAYAKLNRWGDAVTAFLAAIADSPPDGRSHYYLGLVYAEQGRLDEAASEAARAVQLGYEPAAELFASLRPEGHVEAESAELMPLMSEEEPSAVLLTTKRAGLAPGGLDAGGTAPEPADAAAECVGGDSRYHFEQGLTHVGEGQWDEAIEEFQAALDIDPLLVRARLELGRVYARQKRWKDAIRQFERVAEANPDDVRAHFYMALTYAEEGAFDKAVGEAEKALRLGYEPARSLLDRLRQLPGPGRAGRTRAARPMDTAAGRDGLTLKASPGQAHFQRGLAAAAQARWSDAITEFEATLEEMPGFIPARIELGKAYARQRRWDDAAACFREVMGINPNDADAHYYLGLVHAEKGEWDDATRQFQCALRINPNHAEARKGMGLAYGQKILLAE